MAPVKDSLSVLNSEFDICVVGGLHTGKSALICQYVHNKYIPDLESSVEELYTKILRDDEHQTEISILDTSSLVDNYSSIRRKQLMNTTTLLFVYAIDDRDSFDSIEDVLHRVQGIRGDTPPFVIAGLKSDLDLIRQVNPQEGRELAETMGALYFGEVSALKDNGVDKVFNPLVEKALELRTTRLKTTSNVDMNSVQSLRDVLSGNQSPINNTPKLGLVANDELKDEQHRFEDPIVADNKSAELITDVHKSEDDITQPKTVQPTRRYVNEDVKDNESKETESKSGCCVLM